MEGGTGKLGVYGTIQARDDSNSQKRTQIGNMFACRVLMELVYGLDVRNEGRKHVNDCPFYWERKYWASSRSGGGNQEFGFGHVNFAIPIGWINLSPGVLERDQGWRSESL